MSTGQPKSFDPDALDLNPRALEGLTVVITGTLPNLSRKQAQELVERSGGKVTGSISNKTNLLIAGDKAGTKLKKAEDLGVEVINESEFLERLRTAETELKGPIDKTNNQDNDFDNHFNRLDLLIEANKSKLDFYRKKAKLVKTNEEKVEFFDQYYKYPGATVGAFHLDADEGEEFSNCIMHYMNDKSLTDKEIEEWEEVILVDDQVDKYPDDFKIYAFKYCIALGMAYDD